MSGSKLPESGFSGYSRLHKSLLNRFWGKFSQAKILWDKPTLFFPVPSKKNLYDLKSSLLLHLLSVCVLFLSPVHTVAEKWDCCRKVRLSPKTAWQRRNSATVALFYDSLTFLRQSLFSATNCRTFFCDSVDRLLLVFIDGLPKLDDVPHWIVFIDIHDVQKILVAIKLQLQ